MMKKSLVALAVVGAFSAPAFADTTLYGLVDGAYANVSGTNLRSQSLVVSGGLATSRLGVKGSEDLGDGLKAVYNLEYALDIASNTAIGSANIGSGTIARQQLVGLSGDSWGTVAVGRLQTTGKDFGDKFDPFSGSDASPLNNVTSGKQFLIGSTAQLARANRAAAYISPDLSGFKVAFNYASAAGVAGYGALGNVGVNSTTGADNNMTAWLLSGSYDMGSLSVGGVYASTSTPTSATTALGLQNRKEYALGASYDFGAAKLFGTYQTTKNDASGFTGAGNNDRAYSVSGLIPAGSVNVVLSYAKVTNNTDAANTDTGASSYSLAALHSLSKTATIYAAYAHVGNNTNGSYSVLDNAVGVAAATTSSSSGVFAVGLSKKF